MLKTFLKLLLVSGTFVAACAPPVPTTPDPNVIATAIAGTRSAALTQTAQPAIPITGPESPTPSATTAASATPFPTLTFVVLGPPLISVSVSTNCRTGPGQAYDRIGALLVGEVAEVVGRSSIGDYWIIRNPDRAGVCWLWGEHASLTGNTSIVPVFTPPPTPTPTPTLTPSLTFTPTQTFTPTPTFTPSLTSTPSPTFTPSPSPTPTSP